MADIPNNAILRIVATLLFPENVLVQNVFYSIFEDTGASADPDDVITDLTTWLHDAYDELAGQIPNTIEAQTGRVYIRDLIDDDWDEVGFGLMSDSFAGGSDMNVHGVAGLVHAETVDPDVMAAKYLAGLGEGTTTDGIFTAAVITAMGLFAIEWMTPFVGVATGGDFTPGVWSPTNLAFFDFGSSAIVNHIPAYQRRRKPGVGI